MSKNLVKYGAFDLAEAEANEKELAKGSSNFLDVKEGKNIVRVVPPLPGRKTFVVVHQHYIEIPGAQSKVNFNCPRVMAKQPCPACSQAERWASSGNVIDRGKADKLWPRKRVFACVVSRANPELGVQVWAFGKQIHERLIGFRKEQDIDFTDPVKGFDVIVLRRGTGMDTKYTVDLARKETPLAPSAEAVNELIQSAPDLGRYGTVPAASELREKFTGEGGGGASDEDLSDTPAPKKGRTAADDAVDADFDDVPGWAK
jgi:hypothetical protein